MAGPGRAVSARRAACERLIRQARLFPEFELHPLDTAGLDARDGALAHAIYDAGIRRWLTLEAVLDHSLRTPLHLVEPALQGVLLAGAAQLLFLERIPDHAAIDESVELAKELVRPGAAGIVNAVLRATARLRLGVRERATGGRDDLPLSDGRSLGLTAAVLPEEEILRTAVATSHPAWLVQRWAARGSLKQAQELAAHSLVSAPVILNTAHATGGAPTAAAAHEIPGHHVFTGDRAELLGLLESRRDVWVQDPGSSRAVTHVKGIAWEAQPATIVDLCAGMGTKTRQLSAFFPSSRIIATDVDGARRRTLEQVFAGCANVGVVPFNGVRGRCPEGADLMLLDVPCSNTGVLARRPEAKYRCHEEQFRHVVDLQRRIVTEAIPLLAPNGRVVYSTCSIDRDENEDQSRWIAATFGMRLIAEWSEEARGLPGGPATAYSDGSYAAVLARA